MIDKLTIETVKRDIVNIDGRDYQLKSAKEFSFEYCMYLASMGERIKTTDVKNIHDVKKVMAEINKMIKKILIAPGKVLKSLNDQHKLDIISFFLNRKTENDQKKKTS